MNRPYAMESMRNRRDELELRIAAERAAITRLRTLLSSGRHIPLPSFSLGAAPMSDIAAMRASLGAHQAALTRLEVEHDRVVRTIEASKSNNSSTTARAIGDST